MSQRILLRIAWSLAGTFWLTLAHAQTSTGIIDGLIHDPSGAALPGVQVVANSPALIEKDLTVYSNQDGYYRLPLLPPGTYTVTYVLVGFRSIERAGLIVNTGQTTSVDMELSLAAVQESVTVVGESPTIDPRGAQLGFNYTQSLLANIPTARVFTDLAATIPGVTTTKIYGTAPGNVRNENVLGAGPFGNVYSVDGYNATDPSLSTNQNSLMSYDTIEEVQVVRGAKPAEIGFAPGGYFQVITKSGGNQFSGDGNLYYQTDSLQGDNLNDRLRSAGVALSDRLLENTDASISLGGRIVRDRLWWFGSARRERRTFQLLGFPYDVKEKIDAVFWKNTLQARPGHRISGLVNSWHQKVDHFIFGFAPSLAGDRQAAARLHDAGGAFYLRWNGTLTDNLLIDVGGGGNRFVLGIADQEGAGVSVIDLVTGKRFRNLPSFSYYSPRDNWPINGSLSWFVPDAAGRHDFKFGVQYTYSPLFAPFKALGDHRLALANGRPTQVSVLNTPADLNASVRAAALYGQDSWTIRNRLTLNVGVRFDHQSFSSGPNVTGGGQFAGTPLAQLYPVLQRQTLPKTHMLGWRNAAPRLAGSWELDARTAIKASYSRYYHNLITQQLPGFGAPEVTTLTFQWNDLNGDREYQVGEEVRLLSQNGGRGITSIDPNIRNPFSDEVTAGLSRELFADFSVNANFIYRRDKKLLYVVDVGVPFESYRPVSVADPGNDGRPGTADDGTLTVFAQDPATFGRNRPVLTNPGGNDRTYKGFEVIANKRFSHNWQFVGSLVISRMDVVAPTSQAGGVVGAVFRNPNARLNARGRDPLNQTYQLKLQGTYRAPYEILLSTFYRYSSGFPFTRELVVLGLPQGPVTVFAEARGSRETDSYHWVDVRAEKAFPLGGRRRLGLILDVFNFGNASTVLQMGSRTGVDLGVPRAMVNPRIARVGARVSW